MGKLHFFLYPVVPGQLPINQLARQEINTAPAIVGTILSSELTDLHSNQNDIVGAKLKMKIFLPTTAATRSLSIQKNCPFFVEIH